VKVYILYCCCEYLFASLLLKNWIWQNCKGNWSSSHLITIDWLSNHAFKKKNNFNKLIIDRDLVVQLKYWIKLMKASYKILIQKCKWLNIITVICKKIKNLMFDIFKAVGLSGLILRLSPESWSCNRLEDKSAVVNSCNRSTPAS